MRLSYQRVEVAIDGQVATTKVEQSYRNTTDRDLEAEYIFPLPAGASVRDFSMWVDGKRYEGKAVDAKAARQTYEDIVRRLQDPGLLEYIGRDLWKVRIYPVPRSGEQKIEITFTSILPIEGGMISYQYHLRTGQAIRTTEKDFTMVVRIKSPDPLGPIYSPSHDVEVVRQGDRAAVVSFERNACPLDKDFQLYFVPKAERVGFSLLTQRESPGDRGYFLLLLSPSDPDESIAAPRDLVIVVDTSSSMDDEKTAAGQARPEAHARHARAGRSLCADLVCHHADLVPRRILRGDERRPECRRATGSSALEAAGGTDIAAALEAALGFRTERTSDRTLQVLFLTDGLPTVGLKETSRDPRDSRSSRRRGIRIYTFGVGDDVDAHLLDLLAEKTSGCSTYVRPSEDLEAKVSSALEKDRPSGSHRLEAHDQRRAAPCRNVSAQASGSLSGRPAPDRRTL